MLYTHAVNICMMTMVLLSKSISSNIYIYNCGMYIYIYIYWSNDDVVNRPTDVVVVMLKLGSVIISVLELV